MRLRKMVTIKSHSYADEKFTKICRSIFLHIWFIEMKHKWGHLTFFLHNPLKSKGLQLLEKEVALNKDDPIPILLSMYHFQWNTSRFLHIS